MIEFCTSLYKNLCTRKKTRWSTDNLRFTKKFTQHGKSKMGHLFFFIPIILYGVIQIKFEFESYLPRLRKGGKMREEGDSIFFHGTMLPSRWVGGQGRAGREDAEATRPDWPVLMAPASRSILYLVFGYCICMICWTQSKSISTNTSDRTT